MKKIILLGLLLFFSSNVCGYIWEMGLKVVDINDYPIAKSVFLYKDNGFYYEYIADGMTKTEWHSNYVNGACDVFYCGITGTLTENPIPIWAPIDAGTYIIKIDNNYCRFTFNTYDCSPPPGSPDFIIQYKSGVFTLTEPSWAVTSISSFNWDKISSSFKQFESDGYTGTGTVAIGQETSFSERYSPPFNFFVSPNQNYLFQTVLSATAEAES